MLYDFCVAAIVYFIFCTFLRAGRISLLLLALSDMYIAIFLIFGFNLPFKMFFIWFHVIKGVSSILGNLLTGNVMDWMGWIDLLTIMSLITSQFSAMLIIPLILSFFLVIGYLSKIKKVFLIGAVIALLLALTSIRFFVMIHGILLFFKGIYSASFLV